MIISFAYYLKVRTLNVDCDYDEDGISFLYYCHSDDLLSYPVYQESVEKIAYYINDDGSYPNRYLYVKDYGNIDNIITVNNEYPSEDFIFCSTQYDLLTEQDSWLSNL